MILLIPELSLIKAAVASFINNSHTEKEGPGRNSMIDHLKYGPFQALFVEKKGPQGNKTHMRHAGIGDESFHVALPQGHIASVND